MIVIARDAGKSVVVGADDKTCIVTVLEIKDGEVLLGVTAPANCTVERADHSKPVTKKHPNDNDNPDDDLAGAGVLRPSSPKPPSLYVRLKPPTDGDVQ